ncbi:MAG: glycosyltransferase family 9 protein [Candidatus Omnitrophica bacterium]|nr:glycosyltransferase family 9 protein [Candidatus Omnitrophota bacterium]
MSERRILIANPFGVGDVLFTTPVVRALRDYFPKATLGYLCNRRTEEMMRVNSCIDAVFVFEKDEYRRLWKESKRKCLQQFLKLLQEIRRCQFDTLVDFSLNWHYSFLGALLGVRRRIGFNYRGRGRFLTRRQDLPGFEEKHVVEYYLGLLKFLGVPFLQSPRMEFPLLEEDRRWAKAFLEAHKIPSEKTIFGMAPGGGTTWGDSASYKHWPKGHYRQLANRLLEDREGVFLLFGDERERPLCEEIAKGVLGRSVVAAGKTTLRQLRALLERCTMLVCNDGGILHVGVSADIPTLSFYGPVDPVVYGPFPSGERHGVLTIPLCCRPCYRRFKYPLCERQVCLEWISPEQAFREASRLLDAAAVS